MPIISGMTAAKKGKLKRALIVVAIVLVVMIGAAAWWLSDYYHADAAALAAMADEGDDADGIEVRELPSGDVAFIPHDPESGLVFYPGGKVQAEAYAPLMRRCAESGILCILVRPPLNLAFFDADAASDAFEQFPDIDTWVVGGHSLGGVVASDFVSRHGNGVAAIVLLASYPSTDLTNYRGKTLTIAGTNDGVADRKSIEDARSMLPSDATEMDIDGGNHAYFGNYGEQDGDGKATITHEEQQTQTATAIAELVKAA